MKKFRITDEDGAKYEVEEIEEVVDEDVEVEPEAGEPSGNEALTPDEIASLKQLAAAAPDILALLDKGEEPIEDEEVEEEVEIKSVNDNYIFVKPEPHIEMYQDNLFIQQQEIGFLQQKILIESTLKN